VHRSLLSLFTDAESSDRSRLAINNISNDVELKTSSVFINFILHFVVWTKKLYRKGEDLLIFRLVDPESLFLSLLLSCFIFLFLFHYFLISFSLLCFELTASSLCWRRNIHLNIGRILSLRSTAPVGYNINRGESHSYAHTHTHTKCYTDTVTIERRTW
jgi:hypothetical protein